jgi:hypothetical protein
MAVVENCRYTGNERKRPDQAVIDAVDLIVSTTAASWTQLGVLVGLFGF